MGQLATFLGAGITSVVLVLVALLLAVIGWFQGRGARAAKNWSETKGEVMEAMVEKHRASTSDGGKMTAYRPRIIYSYRINGRDYVGERLNFGTEVQSSIKTFADDKVKQFATGTQVTVFYDPQNPNEAALEKSAPSSRLLYVIALAMFAGAILACLLGAGMGTYLNLLGFDFMWK